MKIGDKLLCKLELSHYAKFAENKWYNIEKISTYQNSTYPDGYEIVLLRGYNGLGDYFVIDSKVNAEFYIWDYFYTLKEMRQLKLNELNL